MKAGSATVATPNRTGAKPLHELGIWCQALGLDAVAVALVWQDAFGLLARRTPLPAARVGLGLVVAFIYMLDRQLDVARHRPGTALSPRHRLHVIHPRLFRLLLVVSALAAAFVAPAVRHDTLIAACWLGASTAGYLAAVQLLPASFRSGTKELTVGLIFATGCAAHTLPRLPEMSPDLLPALALTGLLFALNCVSISTREARLDARQGFPGLAASPALFTTVTLILIVGALVALSPVSPPVVLSALLLLLLQRTRRPSTWHRLAADAALLSPLLLRPLLAALVTNAVTS